MGVQKKVHTFYTFNRIFIDVKFVTHVFSLLIFFRVVEHALYATHPPQNCRHSTDPISLDRYIAVRNSATVPQMSAVWTASVPSSATARDAQSAVTSRKWEKMPDGFHEVTQLISFSN